MDESLGKEIREITGDKASQKKRVENDIYTMPSDFYVQQKKQGSGKGLRIALFLGVLFIAFGGATAYVLLTREAPEVVQEQPALTDTQSVEIPEVNPISPVDEESTIIVQDPPEDEAVEPLLSDTPMDIDDPIPTALPTSIDLDSDGLTDIEETLLKTDPAKADTDGDGFLDGAEIASGYDPGKAGVDLSNNSEIKSYINIDPSFSIRVPASWGEQRPPGENIVQFIALNSDVIIFEVFENRNDEIIDDWFVAHFPGRSSQELIPRTIGGTLSKESPKRREVYIPVNGDVLVVKYDIGNKKEIAYPTIWNFILDSITL